MEGEVGWTDTTVASTVWGAVIGLVGAVLLRWVVWPHVLGWPVERLGKDNGRPERRRPEWELVLASTCLGIGFGMAIGYVGLVLFVWGLAMWAFDRTARLGNDSAWERP